MTTNKQSGFGIAIIIVAIVVVAILGYAGYKVYTAQTSKPANTTTSNTANNQTNSNASNQNTNTQVATYLDIKELGIKIKLDDSIKDATYYYSPQLNSQSDPQQVSLSTKSITDASGGSCSASVANGGLGTIIKTNRQDLNGVSLVPNGTTIFKLGDNYYYYTASGAPCSTDANVSALLTQQRSTLRDAFKTVQLDN